MTFELMYESSPSVRTKAHSTDLFVVPDPEASQAAKLVGRQDLLHVLKEIDAMKLDDIEASKSRKPVAWSLWRRPSCVQA
jgi:hypothetical protein